MKYKLNIQQLLAKITPHILINSRFTIFEDAQLTFTPAFFST